MEVFSLSEFLATGVFAFMLIFIRFGTAIMVMPGFGDSFVSERIRMLMVLGFVFALLPVLMPYMPQTIPPTTALLVLIVSEFIIGLFFGTVARIFMTALDTAGMVISIQSGLGNAQLFNPTLASQGSLIGAFLSITGIMILFATNLHHMLIVGMVQSYQAFPVGEMPDGGSMAEVIARSVAASFLIGVKLATPFIITGIVIYTGMGVLSRLMPQIQVFMLALPLQILLAMTTLSIVIFTIFGYWISQFEQNMMFIFGFG
ncbi:MAG: flagellar biosynthetic protein FliR [Alphaproteobacteria bacterium]